ncbi:MAG TPA: metallophosphoesterase family protein [Phototrophicaceae bacterium]|nr:metallophosphoesterase family protein [Phototrophicaceae bacterium]
MRIAILADIHGNSIALDAVLADIQAHGGADGYWILGDLCAVGFDPAGVLDRLNALPNTLFIRGNADRYVATGNLPDPSFEQVRANNDLIPLLAEVVGHFNWVKGNVTGRGWLGWLATLPTEQRLTLPDGTRVLLVHGTLTRDDTHGLNPGLTDNDLRGEIADCQANLICVGHFHMPMDRRLDGVRIINPGAVSNNFAPDLRAGYAILTADVSSYAIHHYRVAYDLEAVKVATRHGGDPGAPYQLRFLNGEVRAGWLDRWDGVSHSVTFSE